MLSRTDLQRLLDRPASEVPVVSIYLDMCVTADNKRTHTVFLNQQKSAHPHLVPALELAEQWLAGNFEEANKGVALFLEAETGWFEALQFPVQVGHRFVVSDRPVVGPLVELLEGHRRHLVVLVDREHMRALSVVLGTAIEERAFEPETTPAPHDVQRGGWSQAGYQRRKAEEVKHGFKEFAHTLDEIARRFAPDDVVLVGTEENVRAFEEFLPDHLRQRVAHTTTGAVDTPTPEILHKLSDFFAEQHQRSLAEVVGVLAERVRQNHYATSGFHETLEQLQEGKVDTLVIARDAEREGAQCMKCGFYLPRVGAQCPYCGGETRDSIDIVEVMIRMAADQNASVEFVEPGSLPEYRGVGALLRF